MLWLAEICFQGPLDVYSNNNHALYYIDRELPEVCRKDLKTTHPQSPTHTAELTAEHSRGIQHTDKISVQIQHTSLDYYHINIKHGDND